jgi:hypothetical protein
MEAPKVPTGTSAVPKQRNKCKTALMKQEASYFEGHQPILIYIARKLKDALQLESILTQSGLDYGVEADDYRGGVIFRSVRAGAFFYVLPKAVETAHEIMRRHGYQPYLGSQEGIPEA